MSRVFHGLTAIELAIVLTIAGFVATFAWPWYRGYSTRQQVAEVVAAARAAQATVEEYVASNDGLPPTGAIVLPFVNAKHVALSDWAGADARGTVTLYTRTAPNHDEPALDAKAIVWTAAYNRAAKAVEWRCGGTPATTVDERYLPAECR